MIESLTIDSFSFTDTNIGLMGFSMGSPAPRAVADMRPSNHGVLDATNYYGPRTFEVTGRVVADSMDELWPLVDNLKGSLVLGSYHTMIFRRQGLSYDERCLVRVDSPVDIPLTTMPSPVIFFGVSLLAIDPRIYTNTLSSGSYDPTDAGSGGLSFALDFPLDFEASSTSGHLTVTNEGNISSPPVIVITGPVTNPIVDNDTTGQSIYTQALALTASDTLTLDVAARTVVLNGTTSRPDLLDSSLTEWFNIAPGVNQLRLRGTGMSAGATQLVVSFRSARI